MVLLDRFYFACYDIVGSCGIMCNYTYLSVYMYVHIYVCTYIYICIYIYINDSRGESLRYRLGRRAHISASVCCNLAMREKFAPRFCEKFHRIQCLKAYHALNLFS